MPGCPNRPLRPPAAPDVALLRSIWFDGSEGASPNAGAPIVAREAEHLRHDEPLVRRAEAEATRPEDSRRRLLPLFASSKRKNAARCSTEH